MSNHVARVPRRSCLIVTTPRTGSWLLAEALQATGMIGEPQEYFGWEGFSAWSKEFGLTPQSPYRCFVEEVLAYATTETGFFSAKLHWSQLQQLVAKIRTSPGEWPEAPGKVLRVLFPDLHFIHLSRADTPRQAISYWRASQNRRWWNLGGPKHESAEFDVDFQQIRWCEDMLMADEQGWRSLVDEEGIPTFEVVYETFVEEREQTVERILDFLDIPHQQLALPPSRMQRQADALTEEWLIAYRIVRDCLAPLPPRWEWSSAGIVPVDTGSGCGRELADRYAPLSSRGAPVKHANARVPSPLVRTSLQSHRYQNTLFEASRPLTEIVANRRWQRRLQPFPHLVVQDLFVPSVADQIDAAVRKILENEGLPRIARYDATGWGFPADIDWPLRLFSTREWRDLLSHALGVETSPFVNAGIHHHDAGGESGRPHNDLNPVYFAEVEPRDGTVMMRNDLVDLKSGQPSKEGISVTRQVRAVSILYYTANPEWHEGDGGETGLFERPSDPPDRPAWAIPPVNNSLLAFECTPNSFHSFVSNRVSERNSVTMWLHRSDADAVARWGELTLERWHESPPPQEERPRTDSPPEDVVAGPRSD